VTSAALSPNKDPKAPRRWLVPVVPAVSLLDRFCSAQQGTWTLGVYLSLFAFMHAAGATIGYDEGKTSTHALYCAQK